MQTGLAMAVGRVGSGWWGGGRRMGGQIGGSRGALSFRGSSLLSHTPHTSLSALTHAPLAAVAVAGSAVVTEARAASARRGARAGVRGASAAARAARVGAVARAVCLCE